MNKTFYLICCIVLSCFTIYGQPVNNAIKDVTMPSPTAASLGKFSDVPVGYYTGVPNVGISIHTVTDGPLSLPVSLNYHAGGIRIGEPVSWVGAGWSLQAGGMISRTIQGKADESCDGYFMSGKYMAIQNDTCVAPAGPYNYAGVQGGTVDAEPDIFSFSVGGYSGKFYIEADLTDDGIVNGKAILIPKQDVKITYEAVGSCPFQLRKFTINTPDGNRYDFGNIDGDPNNKGIDVQQFNEGGPITISGWHLRKFSSADGHYSINLNYTQEKYRYHSKASGERNFNPIGGFPISTPNGGYYHHLIDILGWRLSAITTTGNLSTVTFLPNTTSREDLDISPWNPGGSPDSPKSLSSIKVESGTYCKQFILSQSYYIDASADNSGSSADKRLKLNSVQEKSCDGTLTVNASTFQYYEDAATPSFLPNRLSSAIDHWGFYNGASSNPHSGVNIPLTKLQSYTVGGFNVHPVKGGSNRETDQTKMMLGTLKKITYPTGGSSSFEYEANQTYGSRTSYSFTAMGDMDRPNSDCSLDSGPVDSFNIPAQTAADLPNLYYTWIKNPPPPFPTTCSEGTTLNVRIVNATTGVNIASRSTSMTSSQTTQTADGKITELFSSATIPAGVPLRFEIWGKNMSGSFAVRKLITTTSNVNYSVGGLRLKKMTANDGTTTGQDVVKSYVYDKAVIPGQSSGILYNMPVYGYVFQGCLGSCNGLKATGTGACPGTAGQLVQTHFFFETSIVPLSSFEGYHLGYSAVREYFTSTATGYYNLYQYFNDPAEGFTRIPLVPQQPRIGSGELESKAQRNASGGDVAYELFEKKADSPETGQGVYIKFNTYLTNGDPGGTPITFWKKYPVLTKPFRYQKATIFSDGLTAITDKQYTGNGHLQLTRELLTNSDGKIAETEYKFPSDLVGLPPAQLAAFNSMNLLVVLETNRKVSGTQVKGTKTEYGFYDKVTGLFYSTTTTTATTFLRPRIFNNYEGGWIQKGQIDSYHGSNTTTGRAGLPKQFTKTGWLAETYEWTSAGLIKQRKFKDFLWKYEYLTGTGMVSKITNPDGQFTEYLYDPLMRLQQAKARANNVVTSYAYTFPTVNGSGIITSFGNVKATTTYTSIAGSSLGTQETFQYIDGLGRGIETVYKGKATAGKDQIVAVGYDSQGRVNKTFEPFAGTGSSGGYQSPGSNPSTLTEYESNPLNRVWKVTPPSWVATQTAYGSNSAADGVLNFNFANGTSASFAVNSLSKTTVTDGNGNKEISFTDKKGRMVLNRRANSDESLKSNTYYVYDDKDRLVRVIPPGATWNDAELVFTYQYTNNDLISQKKVPGKAYEAYEYNGRDLPVRYQDPILRAGSKWMGSKYDDYGRLTQKGIYASGSGDGIALTSAIIENIYSTATSGIETDKLKTTKVQILTNDPVTSSSANSILQTTLGYDSYGRLSSATGNNHTNVSNLSAEVRGFTYDHGDNILSDSRTSISSAGTVTVGNSRLFDNWGRLTQTNRILNGVDRIISQMAYTDKDQLLWKKLGGGLQQIDYTYLPNGFLADINGTADLPTSTYPVSSMVTSLSTPTFSANNNGDLFREVLRYNNPTAGLFGTVQQNGNIGLMYWQVKGRAANAYGFTYDYLDRLTIARHTAYTATGTLDPVDYFGENMTYDARGNITAVTRKGMVKGPTNYTNTTIDDQSITIQPSGNRSASSTGASSISPANTNMDVPHNFLNLPSKFDYGSNNRIELLYDGMGNKLKKTVTTNNVVTLTQDYLDEIELKNNKVDAVYHDEGRAFNTASTGQTYRNEFVLRDHLGNTRIVFTDKGAAGIQDQTEILSETHYYPFGKTFDGAWYNDATASKYRYLYNGKELNEEFNLNFYDYGARWLDPGIGSWWEVDPMAEKTLSFSPYAYANDNPISMVDRDGRYAVSVHYDITYQALLNLGYSQKRADLIAQYSSTYADHPNSNPMLADHMGHGISPKDHHLAYRSSINYSATSESQAEKNSMWHSMMSDAEAENGMSRQAAMNRGLKFGWDNIFAQKDGENLGKLGQGLHALQDAMAHQGVKTGDHLFGSTMSEWGTSTKMMWNDMYGSTKEASALTRSALVVSNLLQGKKVDVKDGETLNFRGMSSDQFSQAMKLLVNQGFQGTIKTQ